MKRRVTNRIAQGMGMLAAAFALAACSSIPPVGSAHITYTKGVPGGVLVQTVKVNATLTAIDPAKRQVKLRGSGGKEFAVNLAGAVDLDRLRVGDQVAATVTQKVIVSLDDKPTPFTDGAATAEITRVSGRIIAIDSKRRSVTLSLDNGTTETLSVRSDVNLNRHKIGDQFVFRVIEMTAIRVERSQ